jgi:hypothetical protein
MLLLHSSILTSISQMIPSSASGMKKFYIYSAGSGRMLHTSTSEMISLASWLSPTAASESNLFLDQGHCRYIPTRIEELPMRLIFEHTSSNVLFDITFDRRYYCTTCRLAFLGALAELVKASLIFKGEGSWKIPHAKGSLIRSLGALGRCSDLQYPYATL